MTWIGIGFRALLAQLEAWQDRNLYEMSANVRPEQTGLPFPIWVSQGIGIRHGPRVKAFPYGLRDQRNVIVVVVQAEPRVIRMPRRGHVPAAQVAQLISWVRQNDAVIRRYWDDPDMATADMLAQLRRLEER